MVPYYGQEKPLGPPMEQAGGRMEQDVYMVGPNRVKWPRTFQTMRGERPFHGIEDHATNVGIFGLAVAGLSLYLLLR